jgi:hypothetical protein
MGLPLMPQKPKVVPQGNSSGSVSDSGRYGKGGSVPSKSGASQLPPGLDRVPTCAASLVQHSSRAPRGCLPVAADRAWRVAQSPVRSPSL